jgi:ABC-type Na+ efflux pump permease subunit
VQFIHQQYLTDHQRGLVKQILTSGAERKDYALGRILSVISIWGTIVITISLIFLAVSLLSAPGGDIKEQNYIFYTSGEMLLAVLISLIGIITAFTAFWLLLLNLFFLLGSPAFLLGLLLGIAAFFIPLDIPWLYFFPGIDIAYFPDILGKLASSLPVDKSLITYSALTNNTIWIITGFFSLRHIVNHKDFITAE